MLRFDCCDKCEENTNTPPALGPLRLEPIYKEAIWGSETWLASDHLHGTSRIVSAPWRDKTLNDIVREYPQELFGHTGHKQFPLIVKLINAREPLSVQVHPNATALKQYAPASLKNDRPKTEAWYIVDAKQQSCYWAGLREDVSNTISTKISTTMLPQCLNQIAAVPGDCVLLPPGTLHALGAGVVVLEVQTRCDVTFRLFDWNRRDASGSPRRLDVEAALASVIHTEVRHTFGCEEFQIDRICLDESTTNWTCNTDGHFHIWFVVSGDAIASFAHFPDEHIKSGEILLTPATAPPVHWRATNAVLLNIWTRGQ